MASTTINLNAVLNFDDSNFKRGIKSVDQSLKKYSTTPAFIKLKLNDSDFRKQYQVILADLQKKVQKTGALNYKTTKGKAKVADSISTIQAAYKYNLEQSQNTKLTAAETNTYKKREEVLRQYLNLLNLIGQETKRNAQLEKERANMGVRMEKARMTGKVAAERQRAYKAEFADEKKAKKADELFRRRWAHEFKQWDKNDAELARLQREADNRARSARIEYDKQIKSKKDSRNADLDLLREMYKRGDSMFENGSRSIQTPKNLNDQLESLKKQKAENEKILAVVGSKTKADKAYKRQIEGENEVIKKQILLLEHAKKQIEYISNPPKGQFQSYINELISKPVDSDMEGLKAKLREEERVSAKRAKAEAEADKERAKRRKEYEKAIEAEQRASQKELEKQIADNDKISNRMERGGNSSLDMEKLRKQYTEEAKLADEAAKKRKKDDADADKASEASFKNSAKAKQTAAKIETALENERAARDKANQTHSERTVENINKEIAALKELRKAENDLDKAQGKKSRNARHDSDTNQRIELLKQETEVAKQSEEERKKADKASEASFKNSAKSKQTAANINDAIENEKIARERWLKANQASNIERSEKNIRREIKALRDLKKAEDDLDKVQGKRIRNNRKNSDTNRRIQDLEREAEVAKETAAERAKAEKDATDAAKRQSKARRAWIKREKALVKKLGGLILRAFSVHQIIQFGQKIAETTGYFQQQQVALEGILGSATKARSVLNDITNFALKSPFRTDELVRFTKQLSAFGIGSDDLFPTVTKLADISAGLGVDMDRIILAYGQVKSAAVLRGQELRQFTEAGIPMVEKLAKKFEELNGEIVTTADVFELISERKVSFEMVSEVLSDMTAEGGQFYKMQEDLTNTLAGQISKLKDMWKLALNDMGKSGKNVLTAIIKLLQNIVKDTASIATGIAAAFATPVIVRALTHFKALNRLLRMSLKSVKGIGAGIVGLASGAISLIVMKLIKSSTELKTAFKDIETSFRKETDKMLSGLDSLVKKLSKAKVGSKEFTDAVDTLSTNYGDFVSDDIINKLKIQDEISERLAKNFGETANNIREAIIELKKFQELEEKRETVSDMFLREKTGGKAFRNWMRNSKLGTSDMTKDVFKTMYGRDARNNRELLDIWDELYDDAVTMFATGEDLSKEEFERIFTETIKETFPEISKEELLRVVKLGWQVTSQNTGTGFNNLYDDLVDSQNRITNSDYYKLQKTFEDWTKEYKDSENFVEKQNNMEAAYFKALRDSVVGKFGENDLTKKLEKFYGLQDGKVVATNFDNNTVNSTLKLLEDFESTLTDTKAKTWFVEAKELFKKGVEDKSDRAAIVSDRMEEHAYLSDKDVSQLWKRYIPNNRTYDELREKISKEYKEAKTKLESYAGDDPKDKERKDKLAKIIDALEILASDKFYSVDLSGGQLSTGLTDFISEIKNAYTRYKEAVQKGGIGMGLNYVRNDVEFTEMFGEFFHGANSEMFKKLSEVMIGDTNAGELLKGKFLTEMEDGVLDFESAITSVADELEKYAEGDEKNRKQYAQAAKQLRQWINTTFSKDDLSIALKELEKQVKSLTNSFERSKTQIDLTRDLQKNGTLNMFAKSLASNNALSETAIAKELQARKEQALRPDSKILEDFLLNTVENINGKLPAGAASFSFKGKNLSKIDDLYAAIDEIDKITELNNNNISGTKFGPFGKEIIKILKELIKVRSEEMKSISGKIFTGDEVYDSLMNSVKMINQEIETNTKHQNTAAIDGLIDSGAYEKIAKMTQDQAKEFINLYMKDNRLDVLADESKWMLKKGGINKLRENINEGYVNVRGEKIDIPEILKKELLHKLDDLEINIDNYNANIGAFGSFSRAVKNYRNAGKTAHDKWEAESKNYDSIFGQLQSGKDLKGNILSPEQIVTLNSELSTSRDRLIEMGHEGKNLKQDIEAISLEQMNKSMQATQQNFSALFNAVEGLVGSMKDFAAAVHKAYDVMNDGENPEWMQEVEDSLGDFGEMFSALITPVMSIISLIATLTIAFVSCEAAMVPMLIAMAAIIAVAAIVSGIVAAAQAHDRALQRSIEDLEKEIEDTQTAMKNLDAAAERMVGINKFKKQLESLSLNMKMYHDALEQAEAEEAKKNTDQDKVDEYKQNAQEYLDTFKNGLKEMFEEITGSVDEFADAVSSAMRSAFQSGENAARNMAAVVKENIGNIIEEIMKMNYLKPAIETAMNTLWGGNIDDITKDFYDDETGEYDYKKALDYFLKRLNNEENVENFEESMNAISTGYIDLYNSLSDTMKKYFSFSSDSSALSGGISGITEDTARTLEGLANSMLMQMILANRELSSISQSGFAQVQVSWFNDMLQQARATRVATENLNNAIAEMRNGVRPMSVTIS